MHQYFTDRKEWSEKMKDEKPHAHIEKEKVTALKDDQPTREMRQRRREEESKRYWECIAIQLRIQNCGLAET